jgi:hypothetical protein
LSENEILNYIISGEEKKDKLLLVFQLTWDDRKEEKFTLNVDEATGVAQSNQGIVLLYDLQN